MAFEIKNDVLVKYISQENIKKIKTDDGYATVCLKKAKKKGIYIKNIALEEE